MTLGDGLRMTGSRKRKSDEPLSSGLAIRAKASHRGFGRDASDVEIDDRLASFIENFCYRGVAIDEAGTAWSLWPTAVRYEDGKSLAAAVESEAAESILEIGLGFGISTLFLALGLVRSGRRSGGITAIDPHQLSRWRSMGLRIIEEAAVGEWVSFLSERSDVALRRLAKDRRTFDLAFVDGSHRYLDVFNDCLGLQKVVRSGGLIIFDDFDETPVKEAISRFLGQGGWRLENTIRSERADGTASRRVMACIRA